LTQDISFLFSVSNLKYTLQCNKWWAVPCTRQISACLHYSWRWRKSGRSCWKV